ncbi:hypothetical protein [Paraburkholderia phytofirmans]|uniref:hypothetical protein n=1 Tax=Paraburkholderia phytofirmans TaxID=261302 RepID=UPI0038BC7C62
MSTKPEAKASIAPAATAEAPASTNAKPSRKTPATDTPEKFRAALQELDAERTALAKSAIEELKPGRPFDPKVIRQINKIETTKNRLLIARFASLLRKNDPEVQAIVYQLVQI